MKLTVKQLKHIIKEAVSMPKLEVSDPVVSQALALIDASYGLESVKEYVVIRRFVLEDDKGDQVTVDAINDVAEHAASLSDAGRKSMKYKVDRVEVPSKPKAIAEKIKYALSGENPDDFLPDAVRPERR